MSNYGKEYREELRLFKERLKLEGLEWYASSGERPKYWRKLWQIAKKDLCYYEVKGWSRCQTGKREIYTYKQPYFDIVENFHKDLEPCLTFYRLYDPFQNNTFPTDYHLYTNYELIYKKALSVIEKYEDYKNLPDIKDTIKRVNYFYKETEKGIHTRRRWREFIIMVEEETLRRNIENF
jgi:hypothetical protein